MKNLTTAFYTRFTATVEGVHNSFWTAIGGRMYEEGGIPASPEFPYAVYSIVTSIKDRTFTSVHKETLLQLSIFSKASGTTEIKNAYAYASALYDECTFTITSNTLVLIQEVNLTTSVDEITTTAGTEIVRGYHIDFELTTTVS